VRYAFGVAACAASRVAFQARGVSLAGGGGRGAGEGVAEVVEGLDADSLAARDERVERRGPVAALVAQLSATTFCTLVTMFRHQDQSNPGVPLHAGGRPGPGSHDAPHAAATSPLAVPAQTGQFRGSPQLSRAQRRGGTQWFVQPIDLHAQGSPRGT
jgi:hypothetical protein